MIRADLYPAMFYRERARASTIYSLNSVISAIGFVSVGSPILTCQRNRLHRQLRAALPPRRIESWRF
jgi:hypothetical protein